MREPSGGVYRVRSKKSEVAQVQVNAVFGLHIWEYKNLRLKSSKVQKLRVL